LDNGKCPSPLDPKVSGAVAKLIRDVDTEEVGEPQQEEPATELAPVPL